MKSLTTIRLSQALSCLRVKGTRTCCGKPNYLYRRNNGGFIKQKCSTCGKESTVSENGPNSEFMENECFQVACPECSELMEKLIEERSNRFLFECKRCANLYLAADFLPEVE